MVIIASQKRGFDEGFVEGGGGVDEPCRGGLGYNHQFGVYMHFALSKFQDSGLGIRWPTKNNCTKLCGLGFRVQGCTHG